MTLKDRISDFFFKENRDYTFITFFRIAVGFLGILLMLSIAPDFQKLFGKTGIIPSDILEIGLNPYLITLPRIIKFFSQFASEATVIVCFQGLFMLASLFLILGLFTRASAALLLFMQVAFTMGGNFYKYGVDSFLSMSLFYLIIFPVARFSLDSRIFKKSVGTINITPFKRMFQLHLSIAYFFCGMNKVIGHNWWNGEAIWKTITLPGFEHMFDLKYTWLAQFPLVLAALGWGTIMIELLHPVFTWIPKTRKLWLGLTISLHLGIAIVLSLQLFSALMIILNIATFYFEKDGQTKEVATAEPAAGQEYANPTLA